MLILWWPHRQPSALDRARPRRRFMVKIADDWIAVDADNPSAVQAAIQAAEAAAAQIVASIARQAVERPKKRVATPSSIAAKSVSVRPAESEPDTAAVKREARALADEVRAAYEAVIVRELAVAIEIERDEADVELLLLA